MSEDPDKVREEARRKWFGRAMVIALLLLVAVYALATFVR
jgi:hypothetical protein